MEYKVAKNTSNCRKLTVRGFGNSGLKPLLQEQIEAAIGLLGTSQLNPKTISIHRLSHLNSVIYRSAIALQLSPLWKLAPDDIAHQLMDMLLTMSQETGGIDFCLEVVSPGWIDFQLSHRSLATVLQLLISIPLFSSTPGNSLFSTNQNLFPIQYTHARCCSLLRLAGVGSGEWGDGGGENLFFDAERGSLAFIHSAEWDLIFQIFDLLDVMSDLDDGSLVKVSTGSSFNKLNHLTPQPPSLKGKGGQEILLPSPFIEGGGVGGGVKLVKRGLALCQAFEVFHKSCRIWGEVTSQQPQLAQARLGLVRVTQLLLRSLLEDYFGVPAFLEL